MVSVDTVFDLLRSDRRRYALYYLDEQETPVPVDGLAEEVARMDADASDVSEAERDSYEVDLRHAQLPKTAEADFVEYDADDGVVRLTDEPPEFEAILTVAEVMERPS
jgi:hypothetical protein